MLKTPFSVASIIGLVLISLIAVSPQSAQAPRQEKLLNGLKVLMWPDPKAEKISVALRIHSGAAFDPQGKEGLMQMLAANLFPNGSEAEFFSEDLGGSLAVKTWYDYIQIDASSDPGSFLTMMETLASAVSNPEIDKENTQKLRAAQLAAVTKNLEDPAYVADQAAAARLLGSFPYGRPIEGTPESVQKMEFADLLDAKQRFLTSDNATIAITGNFDRLLAMKALRRYFGGWLKSDKKVPSTFRQPEAPPTSILNIQSPKPEVTEIRYAMRGVSRSDKELAASLIFTDILEGRLRAAVPASHTDDLFVRNEPHILPGVITIGFTASKEDLWKKIEANDLVSRALAEVPTDAEVQKAKGDVNAMWSKRGRVDIWLDADTFQLAKPEQERSLTDKVTLADVKIYAEKLRQSPVATVLVNTPAKE